MHDTLTEYRYDAPTHGSIEHHIAREDTHIVGVDYISDLEYWVAAMEAYSFSLGSQCHDIAIVRTSYAHRLTTESRRESLLHGTEETVAVDQCVHTSYLDGLCIT